MAMPSPTEEDVLGWALQWQTFLPRLSQPQ